MDRNTETLKATDVSSCCKFDADSDLWISFLYIRHTASKVIEGQRYVMHEREFLFLSIVIEEKKKEKESGRGYNNKNVLSRKETSMTFSSWKI